MTKQVPNEGAHRRQATSGNKMQQQQQRQRVHLVNQQQQRRKWSDWSECSTNCFKTRHRLNCDDLLAAQDAGNNNKTITATTTRQPTNEATATTNKSSVAANEDDEEELLTRADQSIDDDDYADEGDEEEETDSCANVDTSKTFEQIPCVGGLCRGLNHHPIQSNVEPSTPSSNNNGYQRSRERFKNANRLRQLQAQKGESV